MQKGSKEEKFAKIRQKQNAFLVLHPNAGQGFKALNNKLLKSQFLLPLFLPFLFS